MCTLYISWRSTHLVESIRTVYTVCTLYTLQTMFHWPSRSWTELTEHNLDRSAPNSGPLFSVHPKSQKIIKVLHSGPQICSWTSETCNPEQTCFGAWFHHGWHMAVNTRALETWLYTYVDYLLIAYWYWFRALCFASGRDPMLGRGGET